MYAYFPLLKYNIVPKSCHNLTPTHKK